MGFLAAAGAIISEALARAMLPPPPPDITRWCEENVTFDERSPMPGPFSIRRFPWLREIHEALSPEHPSREVTVRGSAQIGKTVSLIQPVLGAWHEFTPLDSLVVHPTQSAAAEWVDNKWMPMRRQAESLRRVFGAGRGDNKDAMFNQETLARNGSLKVASSGSPADLTGTSRRLVIMDDLSKFVMSEKGDPEALAVSRASGFEDAKIFRVSTPLVKGTCRITRAFDRSDRRFYHVPCPHCGKMAPLTWENFVKSINPERLHAAHFTCESCGAVITHADKEAMIAKGNWVASNPAGDHPGFHLWRAYAPQRDWASIAVDYAQVMGWSGLTVTQASDEAIRKSVEAETEQTFWNDVLGLPFEQATKGPDWEALRNRVEHPEEGHVILDRGVVPSCGVMLMGGTDCQLDRIEVTICAYGRNYRRWVVDHIVIPFHIGEEEGRAALDALLKATWRTELGLRLSLDMMAVDEGAYTEDVRDWAKKHPWTRVILIKGSSTATGPMMRPQQDRKANGKQIKRQKRGWMLNVSQMKADFYAWLAKEDPQERGFVGFARGLGDEYYRQITSEVRVLKRAASGVMLSRWELVEPTRRNECLDTMNYSEAAARKRGWTSATDEYWAALEAERGAAPAEGQADLFDPAPVPTPLSERATATKPRAAAPTPVPVARPAVAKAAPAAGNWITKREGWL
jgi:phage terminase large subunit GpA-like protein